MINMIKDFYVKTNVESELGVTSCITNQFISVEEACNYMRRVTREYAGLKYHGIIKAYNIQCVSIDTEADEEE